MKIGWCEKLIMLSTLMGMILICALNHGCANQTKPTGRSSVTNEGPQQPQAQNTRNIFVAGDYVEGSGKITSSQPSLGFPGELASAGGSSSAGGSAASGMVRSGMGGIRSGRNTQVAVNWNDASAKSNPGGITQTPQTGDIDQRGDARQRVDPDIQATANVPIGAMPSAASTNNQTTRGSTANVGPVTQDQHGNRTLANLRSAANDANPLISSWAKTLLDLMRQDGLIPGSKPAP